jgi:hypothetical protein
LRDAAGIVAIAARGNDSGDDGGDRGRDGCMHEAGAWLSPQVSEAFHPIHTEAVKTGRLAAKEAHLAEAAAPRGPRGENVALGARRHCLRNSEAIAECELELERRIPWEASSTWGAPRQSERSAATFPLIRWSAQPAPEWRDRLRDSAPNGRSAD